MRPVIGRKGTRRGILIVGDRTVLHERVRAGIARFRDEPVWFATRSEAGYPLAKAHQPGLVVLDFRMESDAELAADLFRNVAPRCWILDFHGIVRRRPEHSTVSIAHTHPLVFSAR